eukprot:2053862-Pyramimonas_sp.AAC.1
MTRSALYPGSQSLELACPIGEPLETLADMQAHLLEQHANVPSAPRAVRRAPVGGGDAHVLPPQSAGAGGGQGSIPIPQPPSRAWASWP